MMQVLRVVYCAVLIPPQAWVGQHIRAYELLCTVVDVPYLEAIRRPSSRVSTAEFFRMTTEVSDSVYSDIVSRLDSPVNLAQHEGQTLKLSTGASYTSMIEQNSQDTEQMCLPRCCVTVVHAVTSRSDSRIHAALAPVGGVTAGYGRGSRVAKEGGE